MKEIPLTFWTGFLAGLMTGGGLGILFSIIAGVRKAVAWDGNPGPYAKAHEVDDE